MGARVNEKGEVGVAVDIDEARRDDQPLGVDLVPAPGPVERTYDLDAVLCNPEVGGSAGTAGAVHDRAAPYDQVELHLG